MKKGILILLAMFMMVSTVEAKNGNYLPNNNNRIYAYENAVNFVENGVEFFVFTNGDFDFDTRLNNTFYSRNGIRIAHNNTRIFRDFRGRINRIGNISIRYDFRGNVARIGNVRMTYFRNRLKNVGNLFVNYDGWGNPFFNGNVRNNFYNYNGVNINVNVGRICNFNDAYFYRPNFRRNYTQIREDNRYFYYKANKRGAAGNRGEILRRRKPTNFKNSSNRIVRDNNNTYRRPVSNSKRSVNNSATTSRRNITTNRSTNLKRNNAVRKPATVGSNRTIRNSRSVNSNQIKRGTRKIESKRISKNRNTTNSRIERTRNRR